MTPCYRLEKDGLTLFVRVTPNAGADAMEGIEQRADGRTVLRIRVSAVPDRGKANKAVVKLLAKRLKIAKSRIVLVAGETARNKTLAIAGDAEALAAAILSASGEADSPSAQGT